MSRFPYERRPPRLAAAALAAAAVGAIAGLAFALVSAPTYEASATLLVAHGSRLPKSSEEAAQAARTVAGLAEGETVATSVADNLRIPRPHIDASALGGSGLVVVRVRRHSPGEAVRAAQQAGLTISQLVSTRLPSSGLQASIWDPARHARKLRPRLPLEVVVGALLGLAAVALWPFLRRRPARAVPESVPFAPAALPEPEPAVETEPEPESAFDPRPEPGPVPVPEPPAGPLELEPRPGRFSLAALEQLVAQSPLDADRADELRAYLAAFRGQEDEHGLLPASLEPVVYEIFSGLVNA
jgi:capsular polysaccharide biosynthesis protein